MFVIKSFDNINCILIDTTDNTEEKVSKDTLLFLYKNNLVKNIIYFDEDTIMTPQEYLNNIFDKYTSTEGVSDTLLGEICSAVCRIGYRFFNDGDMIGAYYGRETCNPAYRFLLSKIELPNKFYEYSEDLRNFGDVSDLEYESWLEDLFTYVSVYIYENFDKLVNTYNDESFHSYKNKDYDYESYDDEDDYEDYEDWDDEDDFDDY